MPEAKRHPNPKLEDAVIRHYPFIRKIARQMYRRLPVHINMEDIISAAVIGLMDCVDKYNASRCDRFEQYAKFRIRGAILDELRVLDHLTRDQRSHSNSFRKAAHRIEGRKGRAAEAEEIAAELGLDLDKYHQILNQNSHANMVHEY